MNASGNTPAALDARQRSALFVPVLAQLEAELTIPYPARSELIAELAAHLGDLFDEFAAQGHSHEEAIRRAVSAMALDREFIDSIDEVHRPMVARALAKLPPPVALGLEYAGIGLLAGLIVITIFYQEEAMWEFLLSGGFFMIPINIMGLLVIVMAIERTYSLFLKKDHSPRNIRRRLLSFQFLGLACTLTGIIGTLMGLFQAFSMADKISAKFGGSFPAYEVGRIAMTTTIWGMTISLLALFAYYLFSAKASRIEELCLSKQAPH